MLLEIVIVLENSPNVMCSAENPLKARAPANVDISAVIDRVINGRVCSFKTEIP